MYSKLYASLSKYRQATFYVRKSLVPLAWIGAVLCLYLVASIAQQGGRFAPGLVTYQTAPQPTPPEEYTNFHKFIEKLLPNNHKKPNSEANPPEDGDPEYLVKTDQCVIPRVPIFTPQTEKIFKRAYNKEYKCNTTDISDDIVRVNYTWVWIPQQLVDLGCSATQIIRTNLNEGSAYGKTKNSLGQLTNFPDWDALEVNCGKHFKVLPLVPEKNPYHWPELDQPDPGTGPDNPINIVMIGIDAVSRLNFLRHMEETSKFVDEHGFQSFYGHHKVGDNTLPNIFGMFLGEMQSTWWSKLPSNKKLDSLPFIQKLFSNAGYLTTYIEDYPHCGLFNFHGVKGFVSQPVEYYLRPVNLVIRRKGLYDHMMCYGNKLEMEHYFEYVLDQLRAFRDRKQKHFTWIHQSTVSHEEVNMCQHTDYPVYRLLSKIFDEGHHKNTVIILYSDHAIRIGPILETESGFHETRLPFLYVYTPDGMSLKDKSGLSLDTSSLRSQLKANSHLLTSHMDLHATFRHLLTSSPPSSSSSSSSPEPFGHSLFTPIPRDRTCAQAGVPDEYCICKQFVPFTNDKISRKLANHVIKHINQQLDLVKSQCVMHEFGEIIQAKIAFDESRSRKDEDVPQKVMVTLVFATGPSGARFDSTVKASLVRNGAQLDPDSQIEIVGKIARNDRYAEMSYCVRNSPVESFCYCKKNQLGTS